MKCPEHPSVKGTPPGDKAVLEFKRKTTEQANEKKRLLPGKGRGRGARKASRVTQIVLLSSGLSRRVDRQSQLQKEGGKLTMSKKSMGKPKAVSERKKTEE